MEDYIQNHQMRIERPLSDDLKKACQALVDSQDGIESVSFSANLIIVGFNPYQITAATVEKLISDLGINVENKAEKTGFMKRWIRNMADSNRESLGSGRLDCCHLNDK